MIDVISFFTGGGFMDIGFKEAGFNICWTNEFNPVFADMHESAMGSAAKISNRASIADLSAAEVYRQATPSKFFGIIGGPPCPDFSIGGKQKGRDGEKGILSQCYIDMIVSIRPSFFVMENVPGLVTTKRHYEYFCELRKKLSDSGYVTDWKVLSALNLGVPQDRNRMFMVGFDKKHAKNLRTNELTGILEDGWFTFPNEVYPNAKTRFPWPDKNKFREKPMLPDVPVGLTVYPLLLTASDMPNGREYFVPKSTKFEEIMEGDVDRKSCKRLHRYRYSPTACYGNNEVHFHPWEPRRISVREALRIQTVPDSYVLPPDMPLSHKFKMIGNGVPCKMAEAVAVSLMNFIKSNCTF